MGRILKIKIQNSNNERIVIRYASIEDMSSKKEITPLAHTLRVATTDKSER